MKTTDVAIHAQYIDCDMVQSLKHIMTVKQSPSSRAHSNHSNTSG